MTRYEYQVIPAPTRGLKVKGVKTPEARFAYALQELMNQMADDGWEFQRAETLPSVERAGLTSSTTVYRNVLVFRRPDTGADVAPASDAHASGPDLDDTDPLEETPATEAASPLEKEGARSR